MPTNLSYGNSAQFVVEYTSSLGAISSPSSGQVTITYVDRSSLTSTSTTIGLTATNSFYLGTWSSTGASLGTASWVVTSADSTSALASGDLRIIDPTAGD